MNAQEVAKRAARRLLLNGAVGAFEDAAKAVPAILAEFAPLLATKDAEIEEADLRIVALECSLQIADFELDRLAAEVAELRRALEVTK